MVGTCGLLAGLLGSPVSGFSILQPSRTMESPSSQALMV